MLAGSLNFSWDVGLVFSKVLERYGCFSGEYTLIEAKSPCGPFF